MCFKHNFICEQSTLNNFSGCFRLAIKKLKVQTFSHFIPVSRFQRHLQYIIIKYTIKICKRIRATLLLNFFSLIVAEFFFLYQGVCTSWGQWWAVSYRSPACRCWGGGGPPSTPCPSPTSSPTSSSPPPSTWR